MIYSTEGVASRGRVVTKFTVSQEVHNPTQCFVEGQRDHFLCWAKACKGVTGAASDGTCQTSWMSPDFSVSSPTSWEKIGYAVPIFARDVGTALYPTFWDTFTLRDIPSIVRASGVEEKDIF